MSDGRVTLWYNWLRSTYDCCRTRPFQVRRRREGKKGIAERIRKNSIGRKKGTEEIERRKKERNERNRNKEERKEQKKSKSKNNGKEERKGLKKWKIMGRKKGTEEMEKNRKELGDDTYGLLHSN